MVENRFAHDAPSPEAATDEPASPHPSPAAAEDPPDGGGIPDFEPVPLRYRHDGLTPERQRAYVEALADCGVAREAAARIGISEQAVNRVRRRADARSFDLACEAVTRFSARRLRSIAFERAIEGTVKRHYYHGELKSEEVVHDNRLLIYLLGKLDRWLEPPSQVDDVAANWDAWMEAIEAGPPEPDDEDAEPKWHGVEVWRSEGVWWTEFPPPAGFDGYEEGAFGTRDYKRTLTEAEEAVMEGEAEEERDEKLAEQAERRDLWFGFAGDDLPTDVFSPREAETLKLPPQNARE